MLQFNFYTFLRTHLEPQTGSFTKPQQAAVDV